MGGEQVILAEDFAVSVPERGCRLCESPNEDRCYVSRVLIL